MAEFDAFVYSTNIFSLPDACICNGKRYLQRVYILLVNTTILVNSIRTGPAAGLTGGFCFRPPAAPCPT